MAFSTFIAAAQGAAPASWRGVLRDNAVKPVAGAVVRLRQSSPQRDYTATTSATGEFSFADLTAGSYEISVSREGKITKAANSVSIGPGAALSAWLEISSQGLEVHPELAQKTISVQGSGGERLTGGEVSSLPLNERDFSKLLLLAAGTMTDANGAANFTQQFAVNGQRGSATVFALDGADTTDPEMGGATFSNFNVDTIQEVQADSGVMPAEIGHGAASYTNVISKSGTNHIHGSIFEFVRNASFDARNFFDRQNARNPRRLPPFARNEFGATVGGPVVIPSAYNGRDRTFFFGEYQGFRQVLGTTQVFSVPTAGERNGVDTTSFAGDTLTVPVNSAIAPVLARYPMPNDPLGAYGARTYATSSKIFTGTDQFSIRIDHHLSDKATLFTRFSLNQVNGPLTNPSQTAIDPSFAIQFFDHQRNAALKYTRTWSPHLSSETSLGYIRSTPFFPAINHTQPALAFADGLYEAFNSADGSILGSFGNLYQFKHDMTALRGSHTFKSGTEIRVNRDSTIFGTNPNGLYSFGGGTALSPVEIPSASGQHDIHVGDPLPDSLTGLLTATPYSFTISAVADFTPKGDRFDAAAVRRQAYNFYFQDTWRASSRLTVNYGLRYEYNSLIGEGNKRTSLPEIVGPGGNPASFWEPGAKTIFLENPQPPYARDWNGWGPRLGLDFRASNHTVLHAGGSIATILPNLWQDNFVTAGMPFACAPYIYAQAGAPVPFSNSVTALTCPTAYTPQGQLVFPDRRTETVAPNTEIDLARFQADLTALTPGH
ncbi:MAG TPA: TonB-dependent receptor, partial [Terriglobia bacterium]|nr:TonB-dependent receptor [Terriglobia bacterium]